MVASLTLPCCLLEDGLARQHDVGPTPVEGDDLRLDLGVDVVFQPPIRSQVHQGSGQECADADVHGQSALDSLEHLAGDRIASS